MGKKRQAQLYIDALPDEACFTTDCNDPIYFYGVDGEHGCFSNFAKVEFVFDRVSYSHSEQFIMAEKARLFDDKDTLEKILERRINPTEAKRLGKKVKNFDDEVWAKHKEMIGFTAVYIKFSRTQHLKDKLLSTGTRAIIEASSTDAIWGIGYAAAEAKKNRGQVRWGRNILGLILMEVRGFFRQDEEEKASRTLRDLKCAGGNKASYTTNVRKPNQPSAQNVTDGKGGGTAVAEKVHSGSSTPVNTVGVSTAPGLGHLTLEDWTYSNNTIVLKGYKPLDFTVITDTWLGGVSDDAVANAIVQSLRAQHKSYMNISVEAVSAELQQHVNSRGDYAPAAVESTIQNITGGKVRLILDRTIDGTRMGTVALGYQIRTQGLVVLMRFDDEGRWESDDGLPGTYRPMLRKKALDELLRDHVTEEEKKLEEEDELYT